MMVLVSVSEINQMTYLWVLWSQKYRVSDKRLFSLLYPLMQTDDRASLIQSLACSDFQTTILLCICDK